MKALENLLINMELQLLLAYNVKIVVNSLFQIIELMNYIAITFMRIIKLVKK